MIPTHSLHEFLRSRRSVRRFTTEPVTDQELDRILTTAARAPSAHNRQPWRFIVLKDFATRLRLAAALSREFQRDLVKDEVPREDIDRQVARSNARLEAAPAVIMLCMDTSAIDLHPDPKRQLAERTMAVQSTAAAGAQLLLAAHAEGLGAVWVCSPLFAQNAVCKALNLEGTLEPQGMFYLGRIQSLPKPRERKPLAELVRHS